MKKAYKSVMDDDGNLKEFDKRNNLIHFKNSYGNEAWKEYDKKNNLIHHKNSNGYEWTKKD